MNNRAIATWAGLLLGVFIGGLIDLFLFTIQGAIMAGLHSEGTDAGLLLLCCAPLLLIPPALLGVGTGMMFRFFYNLFSGN